MAPAPTQMPSIAAMIGCGQARIAFTSSPVMRVNCEEARHVAAGQRPMISMHVAAGAEIAAGPGQHHRLDVEVSKAAPGTGRRARHSSRRSAGSSSRAGSA
jgi:hypothetical protein